MSLITATTPQVSVSGQLKSIRDQHEAAALQRLLTAVQIDLATLQANHNLLLKRIDAVSALATTLAGGTVTGTVFAGWFATTHAATYGADVAASQANLLTGTLLQP